MAGYRAHFAFGVLTAACVAVAMLVVSWVSLNVMPLVFLFAVIGSMLPDLDSDTGVPVRLLFGTLAVATIGLALFYAADNTATSDRCWGWIVCLFRNRRHFQTFHSAPWSVSFDSGRLGNRLGGNVSIGSIGYRGENGTGRWPSNYSRVSVPPGLGRDQFDSEPFRHTVQTEEVPGYRTKTDRRLENNYHGDLRCSRAVTGNEHRPPVGVAFITESFYESLCVCQAAYGPRRV